MILQRHANRLRVGLEVEQRLPQGVVLGERPRGLVQDAALGFDSIGEDQARLQQRFAAAIEGVGIGGAGDDGERHSENQEKQDENEGEDALLKFHLARPRSVTGEPGLLIARRKQRIFESDLQLAARGVDIEIDPALEHPLRFGRTRVPELEAIAPLRKFLQPDPAGVVGHAEVGGVDHRDVAQHPVVEVATQRDDSGAVELDRLGRPSSGEEDLEPLRRGKRVDVVADVVRIGKAHHVALLDREHLGGEAAIALVENRNPSRRLGMGIQGVGGRLPRRKAACRRSGAPGPRSSRRRRVHRFQGPARARVAESTPACGRAGSGRPLHSRLSIA